MKLITKRWLKNRAACSEGIDWFVKQKKINPIKVFEAVLKSKSIMVLRWGNWGIVRCFNKKERVKYALFVTRIALKDYREKHPKDKGVLNAMSAENAAENAAASAAMSATWGEARSVAWRATMGKILRHGIKILKGEA